MNCRKNTSFHKFNNKLNILLLNTLIYYLLIHNKNNVNSKIKMLNLKQGCTVAGSERMLTLKKRYIGGDKNKNLLSCYIC